MTQENEEAKAASEVYETAGAPIVLGLPPI